jgi:serine phosphatase RsbU (regulator of sigma subunit)
MPIRALVIGAPAGFAGRGLLPQALAIDTAAPAQVGCRLKEHPPEVVLVDGALPLAQIEEAMAAVMSHGEDARPALIVVVPAALREEMACLEERCDEVVSLALGPKELLARVRGALRVRGYTAELGRKNAELQGLYTRFEALARRMGDELRLASKVQRSLLPAPLHHPRIDVAWEFLPVREIGGDYFDLVPLGPQRLALALGDVMGKGVPAALLAANLKSCLRAQLHAGEVPLEEQVARVNRLYWEVIPKGLFASLFFGVFDFEQGRLEYVNAGHDHPFHLGSGGALSPLVAGGPVLGVLEHGRYDRASIPLGAGDLVVFFTDGVTDRPDREGERYGIERLREAAARSRGDTARIVLYTLLGEVQGWSSGTPPEDDVTLVVAKMR